MATEWRITGQRQSDVLTSGGTFDPSMEINFETIPEGIPGMVTVSLRIYDADTVRSLIEQRVAAIKAVQDL